MMVLTGKQIIERMDPGLGADERLYISPLGTLAIDEAAASIDVHLGQEFLTPQRTSAGYLDPGNVRRDAIPFREMGAVPPDAWEGTLDRVCVPINGEFMLHPRQFALASVYEFVKLPLDLCADVVGRSSWARVGLIVAMATFVHPGYAGCLTLELQNLGEVPLRLKPGLRVAQLIFREAFAVTQQPPDQLACAYGPEYWPVMGKEDKDLIRDLDQLSDRSPLDGDEPPPTGSSK